MKTSVTTFQILLNNEGITKVIGTETVIKMSPNAMKLLAVRLGYPEGVTVKACLPVKAVK